MFRFSRGFSPSEDNTLRARMTGDFSAVAFAFFVYSAVGALLSIGVSSLLRRVGFLDSALFLNNAAVFSTLVSTVPMYAIGIPVFFRVLRPKEPKPMKQKAMSFAELLVLFFISRLFVLVGSTASSFVITILENITGVASRNSTTELVSSMPIWFMLLVVVIVAPIIEEILFRRAAIDRLAGYGRPFAVLFSALIFGIAHGNFYQFFYTFLLGLLFGYIYAKTGKITYVVILHMVTNFLGSVAVLPIQDLLEEYQALLPTITEDVNTAEIIVSFGLVKFLALFSFIVWQYGIAFIGLCFFIMYYKTLKRFVKEPCKLPSSEMAKASFLNLGFLLFFAFSVLAFIYEY